MRRVLSGYAAGVGMLVALTLALAATSSAADVETLLSRVRSATNPARTMRADIEMEVATEGSPAVTWRGDYHREPGSTGRASIRFTSPVDIRGTRVSILHDKTDEAYARVWIPAIQRQREIRGDLRGESFLGTDFNYEDLGFGWLDYQGHVVGSPAIVDDQPCTKLESAVSRGWWYGKIVRLVSDENGLPLRTEYFDRSGILWKVRTIEQVDTVAGRPTPVAIRMETLPSKTRTTLRFSNVHYDLDIPDDIFTIAASASAASAGAD